MDMLLPVSIVQEQHLIQALFPTQAMLISWEWNTRTSQAATPLLLPRRHPPPPEPQPGERSSRSLGPLLRPVRWPSSTVTALLSQVSQESRLWWAHALPFIPAQGCYLGIPLPLLVVFPGLQEFPDKMLTCFLFSWHCSDRNAPENELAVSSENIKNVTNDSTTWLLYKRKDSTVF